MTFIHSWTQEDCSFLCHRQFPNDLGLSHVSGEGSCLGPRLRFPTNSGTAWAYSTDGQWRGGRCLCPVWPLPLAHRTVILHSSLALCPMSGNLPSELHRYPPYRYLFCVVSWPFQSMSSLLSPINIVLLCSWGIHSPSSESDERWIFLTPLTAPPCLPASLLVRGEQGVGNTEVNRTLRMP